MPDSTLLVRNGTVYDGTGAPPRRADLRLENGRIVALEPPGASARGESIDAEGAAVAPGFIDIHGHSDMAVTHPDASELLAPFLLQGITTQAVGNCGLGVAPAPAGRRELLRDFMALLLPADSSWRWESFGEWLDTVEASRPPFNVAPLVAHGAVRCAVLGGEPGPARGEALREMRESVEEALDAGALGLSAGLIYPPGLWADTDELVTLARPVAARDGLFACHVRGSSELAVEATAELLEIGRRTGVRLEHSHHEAFGPGYWELARRTLAMEERARQAGIDVASDVIPYHAVNTTLLAVFPPWALAGGVQALVERLGDDRQRARIEREIHDREARWPPWEDGWAHNLVRAGGWDNIVLLAAAGGRHERWLGRSLTEIARDEDSTPFRCACEVVRATGGEAMARYHAISGAPGDDGVLQELLSHPSHSVAVDVILKGQGVAHPGGYGALPRLLGHYARDRGWFGLAEGIRKATDLPARRLGLRDRGRIGPGMAADVVVFEPRAVAERGSWTRPDRPPAGVRAVIVNGRLAVADGRIVEGRAGRVLRRSSATRKLEPDPASP